jgi:hypothetical protein
METADRGQNKPKNGAGKPILIVMIIMVALVGIIVIAWPYLK